MTTTSQQPSPGEPNPGGQSGGNPAGGGRPGSGHRRGRGGRSGRTGVLVAVVVVVVVVLAAVAWLFAAGPLSSSGRAEREVEQTLQEMTGSESFSEFNNHLCAENRVPQDLVDSITASGEQTGTDLDAMMRESIAGSFPSDLRVTGVEIDGENATATVESEAESEDAGPGSGTEQVQMRHEDGAWTVCQPGVGMGAVPESEQPG